MNTSVLFVDDDPFLLAGLRRLLRPHRQPGRLTSARAEQRRWNYYVTGRVM